MTFFAEDHFTLPNGFNPVMTLVDEAIPCVTGDPIPPTRTAVCGPNNDLITIPEDQPEGILVHSSSDWTDNTWIVTLSADDNFVLPDDTHTEHVFNDEALPCPTDTPAPPVQVAVCGPSNDLITIPEDQPDGVTLDDDSGWVSNTRIISFVIDPAFVTDGPTTFTLTDANEPCPAVGKQVTITFETSDGGSVAGTEYALYGQVASQVNQPVFADGVIDPDNQIVLEGLIAGDYRLVTAPIGYELVDTVLSVGSGEDAETFSIQVTALQVETPALSPSPEPTVAPSPTVVPTEVPPTPTTTVTGLPDTGSGSTGTWLVPVALIAVLALMAGIMTGNRHRVYGIGIAEWNRSER